MGLTLLEAAELKKILDLSEAYRYGAIAGDGSGRENVEKMLGDSLALLKKIEQSIRK